MPDLTQSILAAVRQFRQVILYGPPGTGKTLHAQRVALALLEAGEKAVPSLAAPTGGLTPAEVQRIKELQEEPVGRLGLVVFHPAYEYEQFVIGIVPGVGEGANQGISYRVEPGIFWKLCQKAETGTAVLIIDEINRGNLPKLLGELVFALEYRDRPVTLPFEYMEKGDGGADAKVIRNLTVPKHLYIIGTMNSSDRSIGHIDVAVRRRFGLLHVKPDPLVVLDFWRSRDGNLGEQLVALMERLNNALPGGELKVGHAYFLADAEGCNNNVDEMRKQVARKWENQVQQILEEYDQLMTLGPNFLQQFPEKFEKALLWQK